MKTRDPSIARWRRVKRRPDQLYFDFSGYSDIAIGAARIMGFDLMKNFDAPYLSKSISEFWRKWHISLSTWFKDYLFIPLGGSRVGIWRLCINYLIVFIISGLWHGAAWTFIVWGSLHGLYLVFGMLRKRYSPIKLPEIPILSILSTFLLVMFAWVFFRAKGIYNSKIILSKIFTLNYSEGFTLPFDRNEFIFCWLSVISDSTT